MTNYESLAVALTEPEGFEMARSGRRFYGGIQNGATGRAPVTALPTTAAAWVLWNGESAGGPSYCIENLAVVQISGTAAVGGAIMFAITNKAIAAPASATGYATTSASKGGSQSKAIWADGVTLADAPTWGFLQANANAAIATIGGASVDVKGRIIVPPGYALAINYFSAAGTTPLLGASGIWTEAEGELE